MSGIDSEDGRKSVEIQEYEYFLYFDRNGIVWFKDVLRKGLAIDIMGKHWEVLQFCFRILIQRTILCAEYWYCNFPLFTREIFNVYQLKY